MLRAIRIKQLLGLLALLISILASLDLYFYYYQQAHFCSCGYFSFRDY